MGGTVRVVNDGASGLAVLADFQPGVVLLDIGMPDLDGYETCRRISAISGSRIGIVAISGWGQEDDKRLAAEAGFDAHITNPQTRQKSGKSSARLKKVPDHDHLTVKALGNKKFCSVVTQAVS